MQESRITLFGSCLNSRWKFELLGKYIYVQTDKLDN